MKRFALLLVCLLLLLAGCGKHQDITLDDSFVIVCNQEAGSVKQAALSLQVALMQKCNLELEVVAEAGKDAKTITVAVDEALEEGQYRTRIVDGNLVIEAQSDQVMVFAMRNIRQNWLGESAEPKLEAKKLDALCGKIDLTNAPFLVLTQNIRYLDDEGGNKVIDRAPRFQKLVQEYMPDIIAMQEDSKLWSSISDKFFAQDYGVSGMFTGGPDTTTGNRQAIFFRADRFEKLEEGAFMLSPTPDEPFTKFEDSKSNRHCTWVLLKDKLTQKELFVCNTHLDTASDEVRVKQANVMLERLGSYIERYPAVFLGDYNATPDSPVYAAMTEVLSDPHITATRKASNMENTYDKYGTAEDPCRLDYLFYNEGLVAETYRVMIDLYNGYISDHYGVSAQYSFAP